jgi:oxalate decarboxylase
VVLTVLNPGGIREPHWHPSAWELNYVISGQARWSVIEPEDYHDASVAQPGELVFLPQGSFSTSRTTGTTRI